MKWEWLMLISLGGTVLMIFAQIWWVKVIGSKGRRAKKKKEKQQVSAGADGTAPATRKSIGGWLGRNWVKLVLLAILFVFLCGFVGPCAIMVVNLPRNIANDGRKFKYDMGQAWDKFTSPAEKPAEKEAEEEEEEDPPLLRLQMISWWITNGKPAPKSGWEEMGTEAKFDSSGQHLGMVPLINTNFWEGYKLQIRPRYGLDELLTMFSDNVDLIDSSSGDLNRATFKSLNTVSYATRLHETQIARDTGLVWVRVDRTVKEMSGNKIGFTVIIIEPNDNPSFVKQKCRSVRYAYCKTFTDADKGKGTRFCSLPLQMMDSEEKMVQTNFDVDIILAPVPEPGKITVANPRVNGCLLEENEDGVGAVMLAWTIGGQKLKQVHVSDWHVRLNSEEDVRPYLPDDEPNKYSQADLWFKSKIPVAMYVAVQIGGTRR